MDADELFVGVEVTPAGAGEQDRLALGCGRQNSYLYTVGDEEVPPRRGRARARYVTSALKARPRASKSAN